MNVSGKSIFISIALPVYNGANYLREALDSILAQEFSDFELVVSDNCSTDETPEILMEYAKRDKRVRVSRSETFLLQADNVNRTIQLCSGLWIKFLCHDDLMHPGCLSILHEVMSNLPTDSIGLIGHRDEWLFANGYRYCLPVETNTSLRFWKGADFVRGLLKGGVEVGLPALTSAFVRKAAWVAAGGFDNRFVHFDVFLWMRLLMMWDYCFVPRVLTTNRIHGAQVAVSARKSLRSVRDSQLFYPEFTNEFREELGVDKFLRFKVCLKPLAVAGTIIAIEILKGQLANAISFLIRMPWLWWPVLPIFILRSLRREKKRIEPLMPYVPASLIYP